MPGFCEPGEGLTCDQKMDKDTSNVTVSEHELRVLVKALAKSIQYIHKKYIVMTFIVGLLIGFGAAILIINVMGMNKIKSSDANVILQKMDETRQEVQQVLSVVNSLTAAKIDTAGEKASVDSAVTTAPQRKEAAAEGIKNGAALGRVKVYIHYARDKDKKKVEALAVFLRDKGYAAVGTEKIPHRKRDIRYFHDEDEDSALLLKKHFNDFIAGSANTAKFKIHLKNLSTRYPHAQKGAIEVWVFF